MDSFIRVYNQNHHYWGRDVYPDWEKGWGFPDNPNFKDFMATQGPFDMSPTRIRNEKKSWCAAAVWQVCWCQ